MRNRGLFRMQNATTKPSGSDEPPAFPTVRTANRVMLQYRAIVASSLAIQAIAEQTNGIWLP